MQHQSNIFTQLRRYFFGHDSAEHWFYLLVWCSGLVALIRSVVIRLTGSIGLSYVVYYGIFLFSIGCAYKRYISPKLKGSDAVFAFIALLLFLLTYVLFPENEVVLNEWFIPFSVGALPMFFVGICLNIEKYKRPLFFASILCLVWLTFYNLYYLSNMGEATDVDTSKYRMDFAYSLLPYLLFISWETLSDFTIWKIPFLILAFFLLIMLGTRGPLIFAVLFIVLYTLFFTGKFSFVKLLVVSTGILVYVYLFDLLSFLYEETETLGMSTRIMAQMLGYEEMYNSREGITDLFFDYMNSPNYNSIMGAGIGGAHSRLKLIYPHNLYVDMVFTFGYFFGNLLFVGLVVLIILAFSKAKNTVERQYLLLMFVLGFAALFLSDTFVKQPWFYMLIGACVGCIRRSSSISRNNTLSRV